MHVLIEDSRLTDGWRAMGGEQRQRSMREVGRQSAPFFGRGLRVLASSFHDPGASHPADDDFLAVSAAPDRGPIVELERAIDRAGRYDLVEQVNPSGESLPLDLSMQRLIAARLVDPPVPA